MQTLIQHEPAANVLEIQRMSTEDGPGLRTTVFFKGCPLRCAWCHNPESISPESQICWIGARCIGCHTCLAVCAEGALEASSEGILIRRDLCSGCGKCVEECPSTALERIGSSRRLSDLVGEAERDKAYFGGQGGVTVSGGEPLLQASFAALLFERLKRDGVHTAVDTSGMCGWEAFDQVLPFTDHVLYDIKEIDPERHRSFTGSTNRPILENLARLGSFLRDNAKPRKLWIRTPVIPGATGRADNVRGIGGFIRDHLDGVVERWELLAFNPLCRDKYRRLGLSWAFEQEGLLSRQTMEELAGVARESGVRPELVVWTGSTQRGG